MEKSEGRFSRWAKSIVLHNSEEEVIKLINWWKTKGSEIHDEGQAMKMSDALEMELNNYKESTKKSC